MKKKRKKLKSTKKKNSEKEKKNEKGEALGTFKVVSYYDNLHYEEIISYIIKYSEEEEEKKYYKLIVLNIPVIKQNIESELRKQIASNNSKHKLSCFITIKYLMQEFDPFEKTLKITTRYFNSYTISLTSSHVISGFINDLIKSFEKELEQAKMDQV